MKKIILFFLHLFFWSTMTYLLVDQVELEFGFVIKEKHDNSLPIIYGMLLNALVFYGTCYWLIPNYLQQKNRKRFFLFSLYGLLFLTCAETLLDIIWLKANFYKEGLGNNSNGIWVTTFSFNIGVHVLFYILALGYRFPIDRRKQEQREAKLEKEKLEAELKFLKAQIDPHTLFNGMNSIYHLIERDPAKAQEVVLQFSGLIRYQLYDCNTNFVSMEKEIGYLYNYIAVNEIRKEEDAIVKKNLQQNNQEPFLIAPLLYTAFIENAFKFLSTHSEKEENRLEIELMVEDEFAHFYLSNTIDNAQKAPSTKNGIGISNTINRLELVYGKRYTLDYGQKGNKFYVQLKIPNFKKET